MLDTIYNICQLRTVVSSASADAALEPGKMVTKDDLLILSAQMWSHIPTIHTYRRQMYRKIPNPRGGSRGAKEVQTPRFHWCNTSNAAVFTC